MRKIISLITASALIAVTSPVLADRAPVEAAKTETAPQTPASSDSQAASLPAQEKAATPTQSGSDKPLCIQQ